MLPSDTKNDQPQQQNQSTSAVQTPSEINMGSEQPSISRVAFKAPPLWRNNVDLWFLQIEAQFFLSGIVNSTTKFHHVIAVLEGDVLSYVADVVRRPPVHNPYEALRERLIDQFSDSETARLKILLSELQLGDKKPSSLLHEMQNLAAQKIDDKLMKVLWLQRLPITMQQILSASNDPLSVLATNADKIAEISTMTPVVNSIEDNSRLGRLESQISMLTDQVSKLLKNQRPRSFSRSRDFNSRRRSRSSSASTKKDEVCWYHTKFAHNARKCIQPCNFSEN